ncbi:MAG: preprotein translocase subunit SecE [Pyrinomonadaceae bacterium]|nr:preprotein translocase subunit SecE [Pyrinomonadaceae bacterium]
MAKDDSDTGPLIPEGEGAGLPEPRAARFGEGPEGRGARRERGVTGARAGFFTRTAQFLHDVRQEMKRVSWPSATDVKNTTIIVIVAVLFFAVYLFAVDRGVAFLITQLDSLLRWLTGSV